MKPAMSRAMPWRIIVRDRHVAGAVDDRVGRRGDRHHEPHRRAERGAERRLERAHARRLRHGDRHRHDHVRRRGIRGGSPTCTIATAVKRIVSAARAAPAATPVMPWPIAAARPVENASSPIARPAAEQQDDAPVDADRLVPAQREAAGAPADRQQEQQDRAEHRGDRLRHGRLIRPREGGVAKADDGQHPGQQSRAATVARERDQHVALSCRHRPELAQLLRNRCRAPDAEREPAEQR